VDVIADQDGVADFPPEDQSDNLLATVTSDCIMSFTTLTSRAAA
jgi:hypothetical protein